MWPHKPKLEQPVADDVALYSTDQLRALYHDAEGSHSTLIRLRNSNITRLEIVHEIRYRVAKDDDQYSLMALMTFFSLIVAAVAAYFAFMSWRYPVR